MDSRAQEILFEEFQAISPAETGGTDDAGDAIAAAGTGGAGDPADAMAAAEAGIAGDATAAEQPRGADAPITEPVAWTQNGIMPTIGASLANAATQATSASSSGKSTAASIAETVLTSGLGMVPLAKALFSIFGGGGTEAPPPLVKYAMPERIDFEGADTGGGISSADYDQMGTARVNQTPTQAGMPVPQAQITVNVQAMDARSFLDHSSEIAQAVREAMLNLSSINDVVNEL